MSDFITRSTRPSWFFSRTLKKKNKGRPGYNTRLGWPATLHGSEWVITVCLLILVVSNYVGKPTENLYKHTHTQTHSISTVTVVSHASYLLLVSSEYGGTPTTKHEPIENGQSMFEWGQGTKGQRLGLLLTITDIKWSWQDKRQVFDFFILSVLQIWARIHRKQFTLAEKTVILSASNVIHVSCPTLQCIYK